MWSAGPGDDVWRVRKIRFKAVETAMAAGHGSAGPGPGFLDELRCLKGPSPAGMTGSAERCGSGRATWPSCCGVPPLTPRGRV
jgi:hypothetical protein